MFMRREKIVDDDRKPFDVSTLEEDIYNALTVKDANGNPVQIPAAPPPAVVSVEQVKKLTAEVIGKQYDDAAKAFDTMGKDLRALSGRLDHAQEEIAAALKHIEETAQYYRDRGAEVSSQVDQFLGIAAEARKICDDMRDKIAVPANASAVLAAVKP